MHFLRECHTRAGNLQLDPDQLLETDMALREHSAEKNEEAIEGSNIEIEAHLTGYTENKACISMSSHLFIPCKT